MLIGIVGPACAGKKALADCLVESYQCHRLRLRTGQPMRDGGNGNGGGAAAADCPHDDGAELTVQEILEFVTPRWMEHFVVYPIEDVDTVERLRMRPFFLLAAVDAPITVRFARYQARLTDADKSSSTDSELFRQFAAVDDARCYGLDALDHASAMTAVGVSTLRLDAAGGVAVAAFPSGSLGALSGVRSVMALADVIVMNTSDSMAVLKTHVQMLELLNAERIRPSWDHYFMVMANLAARRSNCMKRRVGAVLVRDFRVIATGYNGTPRRTKNCNQGGCPRCNTDTRRGHGLDQCLCLHAEENALLEAGRERAEGTTLYCSACPCLSCAKKIVQSGVVAVVYAEEYAMGHLTAALLSEAGVQLRRLSQGPPLSLAAHHHMQMASNNGQDVSFADEPSFTANGTVSSPEKPIDPVHDQTS